MPFLSSNHGHGAPAPGQLVHVHQPAQPVYIHQQQQQQQQQQRQPSPQAYTSSPPKPRKPSVFRQFNHHAVGCPRCVHPLEVVRRGEQLCDVGHELAYEVTRQLYKLGGETAQRHEAAGERSCVNILCDFTPYDGPVYELAKALDKGLNKRAAKAEVPQGDMAVYYQPLERKRRESTSPPAAYYTTNSSSSSSRRGSSNASSSGAGAVPRGGGNIRVNLPIEYGKEADHYEEICHSNGGRVTTKYYHADPAKPRLPREDSFTQPASSKPRRSRASVHFDPEVKYYT